jgi:hypothetical protein
MNKGSEFESQCGQEFSLFHTVQTGSIAHPVLYPVGTRGLSLGVKRSGHEADHSPPTSAKFKKRGSIHSFPIRLHGVMLE